MIEVHLQVAVIIISFLFRDLPHMQALNANSFSLMEGQYVAC